MLVCQFSVVCLLLVPRSFHVLISYFGCVYFYCIEMGDCVQHDRWRDALARPEGRREQGIGVFQVG